MRKFVVTNTLRAILKHNFYDKELHMSVSLNLKAGYLLLKYLSTLKAVPYIIFFDMTNENQTTKKVTLKPAQIQALIVKAEAGESIDFLKEATNIKRLKQNITKCLTYFLFQDKAKNMSKNEIEEILLLTMILEDI